MPYARINMAEFRTREEMIKTLSTLKSDIKSVFPEISQNVSRNSFTLTFAIALKAFDEFGHLSIRVSV